MEIRTMTMRDYESVHQLWLGTPGMGLNNLDDSREGIARYLARNPATCFVAVGDQGLAGAILAGHDGRRGYIYHTAVAVSERKKGIGNALLEAALAALEREGITKAALVVFSRNETGNGFWENRGFTARNDLVYRNKAIQASVRIDT
ncbi:Acetyltransferase, GNAT family [uncultured delta proteobacterium]|uniref:Acetyltransferase, GNAT family n=1 Tax=uncultured delta proteobacterium TaxID=34034 RepID=A0A212K6I4_9DELT|nr:Acetyltransferase, GNAT family [uncultured delta proteobacterium]